VRLRVCSLSSSISKCCLKNLRPDGAIRGSVEPSEGKGGESVVAIPKFSMW
jgi:hypothetical protein